MDSDNFLGVLDEFLDSAEQIEIEEAPTSSEIGGHNATSTHIQTSKTQAQIEHPTTIVHCDAKSTIKLCHNATFKMDGLTKEEINKNVTDTYKNGPSATDLVKGLNSNLV